jgi:tol-pal system protein YbgF
VKTLQIVTPLLLLSFAGASGCATQNDVMEVQRDRDLVRSQLADSRASMDDIRREIERVRGEVEEVRNRVDRVAGESNAARSSQLQSLEERLAMVEQQLSAAREAIRPPTPPPSTSAVVTPPPAVTAQEPDPSLAALTPPEPPQPPALSLPPEDEIVLAREPLEVQGEYRLAWQALRDQQYDRAIQQFRTFQRKNPASEMADDAQYWIGESYFSRRDYNRAILELNDVLKYRRGDKVPAALLRQAEAFVEIGDKSDARLILQKLVNDYPNSGQAKEAKERLQTIGR